jgi:hypothetical protein
MVFPSAILNNMHANASPYLRPLSVKKGSDRLFYIFTLHLTPIDVIFVRLISFLGISNSSISMNILSLLMLS